MKEIPKEWKGTPEQWVRVIEAFGNMEVEIKKDFKHTVKTFQELYCSLSDIMKGKELKRMIKKEQRQQSIRDKRQQIIRSKRRQQLLRENQEKSNN